VALFSRCYASAECMTVCPVSVCLSLCLSDTSRFSSKRLNRLNSFSAERLPSAHHTLCYKETRVSSITTVLHSGTLAQNSELSIIASLSHSASTFVYSTSDVTQGVARFFCGHHVFPVFLFSTCHTGNVAYCVIHKNTHTIFFHLNLNALLHYLVRFDCSVLPTSHLCEL